MWFVYLIGFLLFVIALAIFKTHHKLNKEYGEDDKEDDNFLDKLMMF